VRDDCSPPVEVGECAGGGVEAQIGLSLVRVRTVTAEALVGENRPHIAVE
jgi:hypothetical protein